LREAVMQFKRAGLVFGHGTHNARDEAAYLILHTLKLPLGDLDSVLERQLSASEVDAVHTIVRRRVQERTPAAYLTREAWLGKFKFYVDERTIVPRSFIAELLEEQLEPWLQDPEAVGQVLDLCTGSGCLAILAALVFPHADVDAVDLSTDALAVAARNVADYHLDEHVHLIHSDAFTKLQDKKYDLIISNPPYVDAPSVRELPAEYLHEPALALGSGEDGLDLTRTILREAKRHLNPGGLLVVEIGHNRDALEAAFPNLPFTWLDTRAGDQYVFMLREEELV
jgi:ribosomal protein L3 glutamine methyltransferase